MANIEDPDELAVLSSQRTTAGPNGNFDASQFRRQVDEDVPLVVIEKLWEEFGSNLAGGE